MEKREEPIPRPRIRSRSTPTGDSDRTPPPTELFSAVVPARSQNVSQIERPPVRGDRTLDLVSRGGDSPAEPIGNLDRRFRRRLACRW